MINYMKKDKVKFTIYGYIRCFVNKLLTDMKGTSVVQRINYLFQAQEDQDRIRLSPEDTMNFHDLTAKLLFL